MNSHFDYIKQIVSIQDACRTYGIHLDRNGKAKCPFHTEKESSFSVKGQIFNCFGCGKKGDVINLVQFLYNLKPHEALAKLNSDFRCGLDLEYKPDRKELIRQRQEKELKEQFEKWVKDAENTLILWFRELHFASLDPTDELYEEALCEKDKIEYYTNWIEEDPGSFYKLNRRVVQKIERRRIERDRLQALRN